MPVLLDRGASGQIVLGPRDISAADFSASGGIEIALVNNMPDAALESTERQFTQLLAAASDDTPVRVRLFTLPETPRTETAERYLGEICAPIGELLGGRTDGLVVTGTEPRAATLTEEPYWAAMTRVVDWARDNTVSAVWSCLAAHAAVLHADGIERFPLREKRSGVFECTRTAEHPLFAGIPRQLSIPHSRRNDLDPDALAASGYVILSRSAQAGVDSFVKPGRSTFLFFQGHPEYEPDTLYREYRRDVARYVRGERSVYPAMPEGYFSTQAQERLLAFRDDALSARTESLLANFPAAEPDVKSPWRATATCIYRNWLASIVAEKAQRSSLAARSSQRPRSTVAPHEAVKLVALDGDRGAAPPLRVSFPLAPDGQQRAGREPLKTPLASRKPHAG